MLIYILNWKFNLNLILFQNFSLEKKKKKTTKLNLIDSN